MERRRGTGRPARAYDVRDLPQEARTVLAARDASRVEAGRTAGRRAALAADVDAMQQRRDVERGLSEVAGLDTSGKARMEARLWLLSSLGVFSERAQMTAGKARTAYATAYNAGEIDAPASVRSEVERISARSLARWEKQLDAEGPAALAGSYGQRSARRYQSVIDQDAGMAEAVLGMLYEFPRATARQVWRMLKADFGTGRAPSVRTVQRYLDDWKAQHASFHAYLKSPDAWRGKYQMALGSKSEGVTALNQVWELDSTLTDVELVAEDGTVRRMALVGGIDVYSRRATFLLCRTSNARSIAALMRRMILEWGVPEAVVTDEGADYTSVHVRTVLQTLGIRHIECPPYTPEAKPHIERVFKTFQHDVVEMLPGYVGHDVAERQQIRDRRSMSERHARRTLRVERMSAADFQRLGDRWCRTIYEQETHGGIGMTPAERVMQWLTSGIPVPRVENDRALDVLLSPPASGGGTRVVTKKQVSVGGIQYVHPILGDLAGQEVRVLEDETDIGRVYVFDANGQFVCVAQGADLPEVDRQAVAREARAYQQKKLKEAVAEAKEAARRSGTRGAAQRILDAQRGADKVKPLVRSETYETEELRQLAAAADARLAQQAAPAGPEEATEADREVLAHYDALERRRRSEEAEPVAEAEVPGVVVHHLHGGRPLWRDDDDKYRWLIQERASGRPISAAETDWIRWYENPDLPRAGGT